MMRHVVWFSCGAASAVAAQVAVQQYPHDTVICYCNTLASEHPDNIRFLRDVEQWIDRPITILQSTEYTDIDDVFMRTKYMAGISGARCTVEMKKRPREVFQDEKDIHVFGYTFDEMKRAVRFERNNPELNVEWVLIDAGITKYHCYYRLEAANIRLPEMYTLGFEHNNCIGCVKATSPGYWNKVRRHFPEIYQKRAEQSRLLGVRLVRVKGERIFLDELHSNVGLDEPDGEIECGPVCQSPAQEEKQNG